MGSRLAVPADLRGRDHRLHHRHEERQPPRLDARLRDGRDPVRADARTSARGVHHGQHRQSPGHHHGHRRHLRRRRRSDPGQSRGPRFVGLRRAADPPPGLLLRPHRTLLRCRDGDGAVGPGLGRDRAVLWDRRVRLEPSDAPAADPRQRHRLGARGVPRLVQHLHPAPLDHGQLQL